MVSEVKVDTVKVYQISGKQVEQVANSKFSDYSIFRDDKNFYIVAQIYLVAL